MRARAPAPVIIDSDAQQTSRVRTGRFRIVRPRARERVLMRGWQAYFGIAVACALAIPGAGSAAIGQGAGRPDPGCRVYLEAGHAWRPPFGLDRIARPVVAVVE